MAKTAFISYASEDEAAATAISAYLEQERVSCWIAPRDVRPGADYASEIIDGIESSAVLVLVLSEHANASTFVKREVERAVSKGKPVFPVRVREVAPSKALELFISSTEWIDAWRPPLEQYLGRLAESIRSAAALYPAGRPDGAYTAAPARTERIASPAPATEPAPGAAQRSRRPLLIAIVALVAIVAVLGTLLARKPSPPADALPSGTANAPTGTRAPVQAGPAAPPAAVGPAPGRPTAAAAADAGPCPQTLAVNRELPTPFSCRCSAEATTAAAIWGSDVYTDDSALCRAALHAGVINADGGPITVLRRPGRALYVGTTRRGVMSNDYGAYRYSIEFAGTLPPEPGPGLCPATLSINRELPTPYSCRCTAQATHNGAVWGSDVYTDDSALCRAALHAGRIGVDGGTITVVRSDGRAMYVGSARGGVTTNDYGAYPASIAFR